MIKAKLNNYRGKIIIIEEIFEINLQYTLAHCKKYSSKLDISCSLYMIFEINLQYTLARGKKYSSKLDISCSLMRIFVEQLFFS